MIQNLLGGVPKKTHSGGPVAKTDPRKSRLATRAVFICYTFVLLAVYQLLVTLVIAWVTKPKFQRNEGPNGPGIGSRRAWTSGCLILIIELSDTMMKKSESTRRQQVNKST